MQVSKTFPSTSFPAALQRQALAEFRSIDPSHSIEDDETVTLRYARETETWDTDDEEEWAAEVSALPVTAYTHMWTFWAGHELEITRSRGKTEVSILAPQKSAIQRVLNVFNDSAESSRIPDLPAQGAEVPRPVVFLGHGHSGDWRKIKDHLQDKHGYQVEAYEVGARAGHTIRDVLESMLAGSSFALLVMTGEDDGEGDLRRARQNVVHEAGLFQGRLGFHRAIAVVESGVEVFSNLNGVDQLRYPTGHVENVFGEILATIRREFGDLR